MTEQPQNQPLAPAQPVVNPFKGIPSRDVWRDVAALGLIVAALFYDWSQGDSGAELWYVDIATVIAIVGLSLTYAAKLGVLGPNWNAGATQLYRLAAAAPYVVTVIVVLILDIADDRGVGVGVAVGLAGAVLAAQPRSHELPAGVLAASDRLWLQITAGLAALAAVTVLASTLLFIDDLDDRGVSAAGIVIFCVAGAVLAAVLALPALGALRARPQSVALIAGIGIGVLVLGMLHIDEQNLTQFFGFPVLFGGWESLEIPGYGAFLLAAAGAAALSPGASRSTGGAAHPISLVGAAKGAFLLIAAVSVVHVLAVIFSLAGFDGSDLDGPGIATLVAYVITAGLGLLGFVTTAPNASTKVPVLAAVGYAVVVIALVITIAVIDEGYLGFTSYIAGSRSFPTDSWLAAVLVAAAIAVALIGPRKVWSAIKQSLENAQTANDPATATGAPLPAAPVAPAPAAPVAPAPVPAAPVAPAAPAPTPAAAAPAAPVVEEPQAPVEAPQAEPAPAEPVVDESPAEATVVVPAADETPAAPEPTPAAEADAEPTVVVDPIVQEASDPTIDQGRLADLAHHHPQARAAVALNPQAYPGLLEWLGALGDPAVDAALAQRRQQG